MALITKNNTFSTGNTILASEHNENFNTIYNDYNGNITNANISASAAIVDTKLATISTASKVSGAALTTLTSIPSGAGAIPAANVTRWTLTSEADGDLVYFNGSAWVRVAKGTENQHLTQGASNTPEWNNILGAWASATVGSSTQASEDSLLVCYATTAVTTADQDATIKTDSANPPTTVRQKVTLDSNDFGTNYSMMCPVKKSDYYLIEKHASITMTAYIIPLK